MFWHFQNAPDNKKFVEGFNGHQLSHYNQQTILTILLIYWNGPYKKHNECSIICCYKECLLCFLNLQPPKLLFYTFHNLWALRKKSLDWLLDKQISADWPNGIIQSLEALFLFVLHKVEWWYCKTWLESCRLISLCE